MPWWFTGLRASLTACLLAPQDQSEIGVHDSPEEVQRVHDRLQLFEHHVDLLKQAMLAAQAAQASARHLGQAKQRAAAVAEALACQERVVQVAGHAKAAAVLGMQQTNEAVSRLRQVSQYPCRSLLASFYSNTPTKNMPAQSRPNAVHIIQNG